MNMSVHDHHLLSYKVSSEERAIWLQTAYPEASGPEFSEVVFSGVAAYHFVGDNLQTIFLSIVEKSPEAIFKEDVSLFDKGRPFCWPGAWNQSTDAVLNYIKESRFRGFQINSAYGMGGWVWAKNFEVAAVN